MFAVSKEISMCPLEERLISRKWPASLERSVPEATLRFTTEAFRLRAIAALKCASIWKT